MCGICGAAKRNSLVDLDAQVDRMNRALLHRGPDSEGRYSNGGVSMAMRRLAIIDLETGDQPVSNEDKTIWVTLNGEVYNYLELGDSLRKKGHKFRTRSDTEVIAHGYEEYGISVVERIKGMFALALYDTRKRCLYLARDRFGEKPLFYYSSTDELVYSSELASLMEWPGLPRETDREALGYYLRMGFTPEPLTLFRSIKQLPAGCWLKWTESETAINRYYHIDYSPDPALRDDEAVHEQVGNALRNAVRRQAVSDVPLGALLSGGIDSSIVAAMLQSISEDQVKTFTVRFEESTYDESPIARAVADHLGTDHHEITITNAGFVPEDLWRIVDHCGTPFVDSSAIPTYVISKHVREHVTVCVTGDGGDEMFAGYDDFMWSAYVARLARIPDLFLDMASVSLGVLSTAPGLRRSSRMRKGGRAIMAARQSDLLRFAMIHSLFLPREIRRLTQGQEIEDTACGALPLLTEQPDQANSWTRLRRDMYFRVRHILPQDMLTKIDRMSMANSLELRAPMLDPDLAELTMKLPDRYLINGGIRKYVLRQIGQGILPPEVFAHPKTGFSIPLHSFQNAAYEDLARELLETRRGPLSLLDPTAVDKIMERGLVRKEDQADISTYRASHQLWALMQLAAWGERFRVYV